MNLEPATPPEFGKVRPALIVSNSEQNLLLPTVVVLPVSSRAPEIWPLRLRFTLPDRQESFVVLPGIRQIHNKRLQDRIGAVSEDFLARVDEALSVYLR